MKLSKHNRRLTIQSTKLANELMKRGYQMQIKQTNRKQCSYMFKVDNVDKIMQDIDSINRKIYYADSDDREEWAVIF